MLTQEADHGGAIKIVLVLHRLHGFRLDQEGSCRCRGNILSRRCTRCCSWGEAPASRGGEQWKASPPSACSHALRRARNQHRRHACAQYRTCATENVSATTIAAEKSHAMERSWRCHAYPGEQCPCDFTQPGAERLAALRDTNWSVVAGWGDAGDAPGVLPSPALRALPPACGEGTAWNRARASRNGGLLPSPVHGEGARRADGRGAAPSHRTPLIAPATAATMAGL